MTEDSRREPSKAWPPLIRHSLGILVVVAIAFIGWRALHKLANNRDGTMSAQMFIGGDRVKSIVTRKAPDGRSFTCDTTGAHGRPQSQTLMNDA